MDLRYFLSGGMILSGVVTFFFGFAYSAGIHSFGYQALVSDWCPILAQDGLPVKDSCYAWNIAMTFIIGFFVNGPYCLITTAVSAELGQHPSLQGSSKALATVTAIIDGTGSIGAALGPFLAGALAGDWNNVFYMLIVADVLALILLTRLVKQEAVRYFNRRRNVETDTEYQSINT